MQDLIFRGNPGDRKQIASIHGNFSTFLLNTKLWHGGNFLIIGLESSQLALQGALKAQVHHYNIQKFSLNQTNSCSKSATKKNNKCVNYTSPLAKCHKPSIHFTSLAFSLSKLFPFIISHITQ